VGENADDGEKDPSGERTRKRNGFLERRNGKVKRSHSGVRMEGVDCSGWGRNAREALPVSISKEEYDHRGGFRNDTIPNRQVHGKDGVRKLQRKATERNRVKGLSNAI